MLFETDPTRDYANVLAAIDGFIEGLGLSQQSVDTDQIVSILRGMRQDFPAQGGSNGASPFKKAANFLCYFCAERPIKNPFPESAVGNDIARILHHQNAMVGLHIAVDALHHATIARSDGPIVLSNRIRFSRHSYVDAIQALAMIAPASHFHIVSVFLEQSCYRFNSTASYELI